MFRARMLATRVIAVLFALALLGSCEYLHGAFARLSGQISITSDSLPVASNGESYRAVLEAAGGAAPYKWVLQDGWLPAGMKLQEDGVLTGTPEVPGEFFFTLRASDNSTPAGSAVKLLKLSVSAHGLVIVTSRSELPWGRVGTDYAVKFTAWGGMKPYAWSTPDPLPAGLKLQHDGTLSGTPTQAGDFDFGVQVFDLTQRSKRRFSLHISPVRVDAFGGVTALPSPRGGNGRWRTEKIRNRWVFVTPAGNAFWMIGIWGVTGDEHLDERGVTFDQRTAAKYESTAARSLQANRRLRSWGFNSVGPWSYRMIFPTAAEPEWGGTQPVKFAYTLLGPYSADAKRKDSPFKNLYARLDKRNSAQHFGHGEFSRRLRSRRVSNTRRLYAKQADLIAGSKSPYFIGAFSDDTDELSGFGPGTDFPTDPPHKDSRAFGLLGAGHGTFAGDESVLLAGRAGLCGHKGLYEICAAGFPEGSIRNHRSVECGMELQLHEL